MHDIYKVYVPVLTFEIVTVNPCMWVGGGSFGNVEESPVLPAYIDKQRPSFSCAFLVKPVFGSE